MAICPVPSGSAKRCKVLSTQKGRSPSGTGVGANGKNRDIFSTGEVFFLLTSPLTDDPNLTSARKLQRLNTLKLQKSVSLKGEILRPDPSVAYFLLRYIPDFTHYKHFFTTSVTSFSPGQASDFPKYMFQLFGN